MIGVRRCGAESAQVCSFAFALFVRFACGRGLCLVGVVGVGV